MLILIEQVKSRNMVLCKGRKIMKYRIVDADNRASYSKPMRFTEVKAWFDVYKYYIYRKNIKRRQTFMDLIDRDYLLDNIVEWRAMLTDEKEKKLLTEVMHCIKAKDTIVDMQKLIDGVNSQKIDLDSTESDIKAASVYNSAIDDSLYEVKNAVYPNYKAFFVWDNAK